MLMTLAGSDDDGSELKVWTVQGCDQSMLKSDLGLGQTGLVFWAL